MIYSMAKRWQFQMSIECVLLKAGNVDIYLLETVSGRKSCTVVGSDSAEWDGMSRRWVRRMG